MRYDEGRRIGYRWFQSQDLEPLFGFGFGLSYTTFVLDAIAVEAPAGVDGPVRVTGTVTNTGDRAGAEVVQVYVGVPSEGQPPKRLVGFEKITVEPGETALIDIVIDPRATNHPFGVWDPVHRDFAPVAGDHTIFVGTSAADTPHQFTIAGACGRASATLVDHRPSHAARARSAGLP